MRPMPLAPTFAALLAVSAALASPAALHAETRRLGAHVHGHGALRIAVEGTAVEIELEAPGADLAGFEHAPSTEVETATIRAAEADLAHPLDLLTFPKNAGCREVSATVERTAEEHGGGKGDDDHAEHGDDDDHAEHGDDDDHADAGGHSGFRASWSLICEDPSAITGMEFPYFARFPNARELEVQILSARGARGYEVAREDPRLDLDGGL